MDIKMRFIQASILLLNGIMAFLYFFLKLLPEKEQKILFCSRQTNETPLDFVLLKNEINKSMADAQVVIICSHIDRSAKSVLKFCLHVFKSMYHLATSSVCIIDSYWPAVSMLKHKKSLKIIQIWHALGKTKKSGYQSLNKKSGRKREFAGLLKMHKNYDYFIGGAPIWNKYYCEAFNISQEQILNYGLPRIDYLLNTDKSNRQKFFQEFPQLRNKKIVLYAPTFRRKMKSNWEKILDANKYEDIIIIIKNHPGQTADKPHEKDNVLYMEDWKTIDLLSVCDYLVTDYSSIALEAAVLKKKTFFWTYDYAEYIQNNGINLNLKKELSNNVFEDINDLMDCIENDYYDIEQQKKYIDKYLPAALGSSTSKIAILITELARKQKARDYENSNNGRWQRSPMAGTFEDAQTFSGDKRRTADIQNDTFVAYGNTKKHRDHSNVS